MQIIGYVFYVLAAIDVISIYILEVDFTGVWWSPLVLSVIGGFLVKQGKGKVKD
jgi:hypothetical protein